MARDRPSRYGEGGVFYRSAVACPPRVFVPRSIARDRPSRYGEGAFFIVARGPSEVSIRASERVSPASSPGRLHRDQEVSPTGENEL